MSYELPLHLTLTGRPLLLFPGVAQELHHRLQASYAPRAGKLFNRAKRMAARLGQPDPDPELPEAGVMAAAPRRYALTAADPAIRREPYIEHITIGGPLLDKAEIFDGIICVDGYDRIEAALARAMADTDCSGILLEINSPGGMVSGCFELSAKIREWAQAKPIVVHCAGLLCSAAYSLASGATEIHAQKTALIGSIGVVYGRLDVTNWNKKNGVKINFIKSGEQKVWGNPETEMDDAELAAHQAEVLELADMFFDEVSAGRGLKTDAIKALEAGTYLTGTAMTHGLADTIGDLGAAIARVTDLAQSPAPAPTPDPEANPENEPESQTAAKPNPAPAQSTAKESPMSKFLRSGLAAKLALTASMMAMNAIEEDDTIDAMDEDEMADAMDDAVDDEMEAMDDEEVTAMDDELDAMDEAEREAMEDEDIEAMDEDDEAMTDEDGVDAKSFKAAASRAANKVVAAHKAASKPKRSGAKSKRGKASKSDINNAVADERARVAAIHALSGAAQHPALAQHFVKTGASVEDAKAGLKAAGKSATGSRMSGVHNPTIGTGGNKKSAAKAADDVLAKVQNERSAKVRGR